MKVSNEDCARILELDIKKAHGHAISEAEQQLYKQHVANCPHCILELSVLEALAEETTACGALPELDELSRRRFVDEVIARADSMDRKFMEEDADPPSGRERFRFYALVGTLAAAAIAAVLFWQYPANQTSSSPAVARRGLPAAQGALNGHFALLSGEVLVGTHSAVIGDQLESGDRVETGDGRTVITLPSEIVLSLARDTSLEIQSRRDLGYEVTLDRGQLHVSLPPDVDRGGFNIVTQKGTVDVTGTVFSMEADESSVKVRVLRGQVEISDRGGRQRRLGTSAGTSLGSSRVWSLSQNEEESLWEAVRVLELLHVEDNAIIDVQSSPLGADVEVDSVFIGKTPVKASIRSGYREIHLAMNGGESARKLVDLHKGSLMSWDVDFRSLGENLESDTGDLLATDSSEKSGKASKIKKKSGRKEGLSASQLLKRAQELRASLDWKGAADMYAHLIRKFPNADETRAAYVSLGEVQLSKLGRPMSALRHFNDYLAVAQAGPLAREALYGKIRSLRALGRLEEEEEAISLFLKRFPGSIRSKEIQSRQKELQSRN